MGSPHERTLDAVTDAGITTPLCAERSARVRMTSQTNAAIASTALRYRLRGFRTQLGCVTIAPHDDATVKARSSKQSN